MGVWVRIFLSMRASTNPNAGQLNFQQKEICTPIYYQHTSLKTKRLSFSVPTYTINIKISRDSLKILVINYLR